MLLVGKFKVSLTFKNLKDFCEYWNLETCTKILEVEYVKMLLEKIKICQTSNGYYQIRKKQDNLAVGL